MTKTVKFDEIEFESRRIEVLILRISTSAYMQPTFLQFIEMK